MADIAESIRIHNEDKSSHSFILEQLSKKSPSEHLHLVKSIQDFESGVIQAFKKNLLDDANFEKNVSENKAKNIAVSQQLLSDSIKKILESTAQKEHKHSKNEISDFEHNHDEDYYTKEELVSIVTGKEGARLIGGTIDNFSSNNVQDLMNELKDYSTRSKNNFFVKDSVKVISTQNIPSLEGIRHTIDGVSNFKSGDRVLLVGQIDNRQNGIYIINSGTWMRSEDMDENEDLADNILVFVEEGLENVNTGWRLEVKNLTIGGINQPLQIGQSAIIGHPFSYNRNLRSSDTIQLKIDNTSNVISPELKPILANMPTDTIMARVFVDEYGRVTGGDVLGPNGKDFLLEDYNIIGVMDEAETKQYIQEEIEKALQETGGNIEEAINQSKKYTDDSIKKHNEDTTVHSFLSNQIKTDIYQSTEHFSHNHNDLYYSKTELGDSSPGSSGANKIGVSDIEGIVVSDGEKNVQSYLSALKKYCDSVSQGLDIKQSVVLATTENIVLSGLTSIDGFVPQEGARILVKDQTNKAQNGIYVASSGTWKRAEDADSPEKINGGMFTFVEMGTTNHDTGWVLSTDGEIVLETTELIFIQFSRAGTITAGSGLTMNGNEISMPKILENPSSFTKVNVDVHGKVTSGENPTTLSGYGIIDAYDKTTVDKLLEGKATTDPANEEQNGLMTKEDFVKLKGIEEGAQKNQNAFSSFIVNSNGTISAENETDSLIVKTENGIEATVEEKTLKMKLGQHNHKVADISDFPDSLPADGGNADTLSNFPIEDFVLHETGQGASDIDETLSKEVNVGINNHNNDEKAHPSLQEKFSSKADLVDGLVPLTQLPAMFNISPVRTAIVGKNGNWFYYDESSTSFVDSGVPARGKDGVIGKDGVTPHIGDNKHWFIGEEDTGILAEGRDGATGKTAYESALEGGFSGTEADFNNALSIVNQKVNKNLENVENPIFLEKCASSGLAKKEDVDNSFKNYYTKEEIDNSNRVVNESIEDINNTLEGLSDVAFFGNYNDLIGIPETAPPAIVKEVTITSDSWIEDAGLFKSQIQDPNIKPTSKIDFDADLQTQSSLPAIIRPYNENGTLYAKTFEKPSNDITIQLTIIETRRG